MGWLNFEFDLDGPVPYTLAEWRECMASRTGEDRKAWDKAVDLVEKLKRAVTVRPKE